jgi:uncharacterized small protein (DUF1192 family)
MDTALIVAVSSVGVTLVLGILQFINYRSTAKKADVESYTTLINTVVTKTKTEFDIMTDVVTQLRLRVTELQDEILELKTEHAKENAEKDATISDLQNRLLRCENKLSECGG